MHGTESISLVPEAYREPQLLDVEKRMCEYFASYYVECHDSFLSAIRLGYSMQYAKENGIRILHMGYTQRLIAEWERSDLTEEHKARLPGIVLKKALKESNIHEKGAGRLAAVKLIANTQGMERGSGQGANDPNVLPDGVTHNVMIAPMADNLDDWEAQTLAEQDELRRSVRD